jgi:hypothetical protein
MFCLRSVGAIIVKVGYGEKIYQEHGAEMVETNKERSVMITLVFPKVWLVDLFPICEQSFRILLVLFHPPLFENGNFLVQYIPSWFPGATFRRVGNEGKKLGQKVRFWAFSLVEKDVVSSYSFVVFYHRRSYYCRQTELPTTQLSLNI